MKPLRIKVIASAEQKDLKKALNNFEKLAGVPTAFVDTKSTIDGQLIKLCYQLTITEDEYAEMGKDLLKIGTKVPNWSFTTQYDKKSSSVLLFFTTRIS